MKRTEVLFAPFRSQKSGFGTRLRVLSLTVGAFVVPSVGY